MLNNEATPDACVQVSGLTANIQITNLQRDDFLFITAVVKLFTDPCHADDVKSLRSGFINLAYQPGAGLGIHWTGKQN